MATETPNKTEVILAKLEEVFSPEKKSKASKKNRVITINGKVATDLVSMKEAKKIARQLATTDSVVRVYTLEGTLTTNLDVEVSQMAGQTTDELIAAALAGGDSSVSTTVTVSNGDSLKTKAGSGDQGIV